MNEKDLEIIGTINSICYDVRELTESVEFDELFRNSETYNDCLFSLKRIADNVSKLSPNIVDMYPDCHFDKIETWKHILSVDNTERNRSIIWNAIMVAIPELLEETDEVYGDLKAKLQEIASNSSKPNLMLVK